MIWLKNKLPFIVLSICVMSTFFVKYTYISLVLSTLSLIFSLLLSRKKIRIMLVTIIISVATIITNCFVLYKNKAFVYEDIFKNKNILVGYLSYNFDSSAYIFNEDFSYIHYEDLKNKDNYCIGTYKYSYGGMGKNNEIIYDDNNYYYYSLNLFNNYCIVDGEKETNDSLTKLVFGINKNDYNDFVFIDVINNYAFKVVKKFEEEQK